MANVTVLGVGAMGSRMAKSLMKAGHTVTVWNRNPDRTRELTELGAKSANTPREAVAAADFAISMVRDDGASRDTWLHAETGALAAIPGGCIGVESSTLTVAWTRELASEFGKRKAAFLDAPVAGSLPQADAAQLIYFVGGDATTFASAEPILKAMGSAIHYAGPSGSGTAIKLMVNTLLAVQVAAWAELLPLMKKCGIDEARALEIVGSAPVASPFAKVMAGMMVARKFDPLFPIEMLLKDLTYAEATGKAAGIQLPITNAAHAVFQHAVESGFGDEHFTATIKLYE